jgi:hypothetical protein
MRQYEFIQIVAQCRWEGTQQQLPEWRADALSPPSGVDYLERSLTPIGPR